VSSGQPKGFELLDATIPEMQAAMADGRLMLREVVRQYLVRLATYNGRLNAFLYVNPRALDEADALSKGHLFYSLRSTAAG
jgi:Asp-tRNA(Asn)/Glu-tRNA(Gln) amidotransferase A subunit family amidase